MEYTKKPLIDGDTQPHEPIPNHIGSPPAPEPIPNHVGDPPEPAPMDDKDTHDDYGTSVCDTCGTPLHGETRCWSCGRWDGAYEY